MWIKHWTLIKALFNVSPFFRRKATFYILLCPSVLPLIPSSVSQAVTTINSLIYRSSEHLFLASRKLVFSMYISEFSYLMPV